MHSNNVLPYFQNCQKLGNLHNINVIKQRSLNTQNKMAFLYAMFESFERTKLL